MILPCYPFCHWNVVPQVMGLEGLRVSPTFFVKKFMHQLIEALKVLDKMQYFILILSPLPTLNHLFHLCIHHCGDVNQLCYTLPQSQKPTQRRNLTSILERLR